MQALVKIGKSQYLVSEGETVQVDLGNMPSEVLMVVDGDKVEIGTPNLPYKVEVEKKEEIKGKKIRVATFKAKSRYRRVIGFRPKYDLLLVKKIVKNTK